MSGSGSGSRIRLVLALIAGAVALAEVVWLILFVGESSDGLAFAVTLLSAVVVPGCVAGVVASLLLHDDRAAQACLVAAFVLGGVAGAGAVAAFFVADDPTDPAWVGWCARLAPAALFGSALFVAVTCSRTLPIRPRVVRLVAAALVSIPSTAVLVLCTVIPQVVVLAGLALPVVLGTVRLVERRRRLAAPTPTG